MAQAPTVVAPSSSTLVSPPRSPASGAATIPDRVGGKASSSQKKADNTHVTEYSIDAGLDFLASLSAPSSGASAISAASTTASSDPMAFLIPESPTPRLAPVPKPGTFVAAPPAGVSAAASATSSTAAAAAAPSAGASHLPLSKKAEQFLGQLPDFSYLFPTS